MGILMAYGKSITDSFQTDKNSTTRTVSNTSQAIRPLSKINICQCQKIKVSGKTFPKRVEINEQISHVIEAGKGKHLLRVVAAKAGTLCHNHKGTFSA